MNKQRRKDIDSIISRIDKLLDEAQDLKGDIDSLVSEEQDYIDNMPENLQQSEKAEAADSAVNSMQEASSSLEEIESSLNDAKDHLEEAKG